MKISEIYGKKTLGADGREGYALSVSALGQKVYLTCADSDEREFTVEAESVKKLGDAIIYDGKESRADGALPVRLGRASFDTRGNFLGLLSDLTLSRGKLKTAKIGILLTGRRGDAREEGRQTALLKGLSRHKGTIGESRRRGRIHSDHVKDHLNALSARINTTRINIQRPSDC